MHGRARMVFIHPSDEMYGADRILLDICTALTSDERATAEFWLPTDVRHGDRPLCVELEALGATVRHVDLPILRRSYRGPRTLARLVARLFHTQRRLRAVRPDLVYLTTSATYLSAPIARLCRVPRILGHKQEMWGTGDARILAPLARACHRLIAISNPVRDNLPAALRGRAVVVVNATGEPDAYHPLAGRGGELTFTVASRWNGWKGHRTLLAAWERANPPGRLVVLGGAPPSGESVDVPALVAELAHGDRVEVVGEVADAGSYLDAADVTVVPSDDPEPFGLIAIEAFARGRPVIGSDAGGLADIITNDVDGWTYPLRDVDALAAILGRLDRAGVNAAGARARATYEERYTKPRFDAQWRAAVIDGAGHSVASGA